MQASVILNHFVESDSQVIRAKRIHTTQGPLQGWRTFVRQFENTQLLVTSFMGSGGRLYERRSSWNIQQHAVVVIIRNRTFKTVTSQLFERLDLQRWRFRWCVPWLNSLGGIWPGGRGSCCWKSQRFWLRLQPGRQSHLPKLVDFNLTLQKQNPTTYLLSTAVWNSMKISVWVWVWAWAWTTKIQLLLWKLVEDCLWHGIKCCKVQGIPDVIQYELVHGWRRLALLFPKFSLVCFENLHIALWQDGGSFLTLCKLHRPLVKEVCQCSVGHVPVRERVCHIDLLCDVCSQSESQSQQCKTTAQPKPNILFCYVLLAMAMLMFLFYVMQTLGQVTQSSPPTNLATALHNPSWLSWSSWCKEAARLRASGLVSSEHGFTSIQWVTVLTISQPSVNNYMSTKNEVKLISSHALPLGLPQVSAILLETSLQLTSMLRRRWKISAVFASRCGAAPARAPKTKLVQLVTCPFKMKPHWHWHWYITLSHTHTLTLTHWHWQQKASVSLSTTRINRKAPIHCRRGSMSASCAKSAPISQSSTKLRLRIWTHQTIRPCSQSVKIYAT